MFVLWMSLYFYVPSSLPGSDCDDVKDVVKVVLADNNYYCSITFVY